MLPEASGHLRSKALETFDPSLLACSLGQLALYFCVEVGTSLYNNHPPPPFLHERNPLSTHYRAPVGVFQRQLGQVSSDRPLDVNSAYRALVKGGGTDPTANKVPTRYQNHINFFF